MLPDHPVKGLVKAKQNRLVTLGVNQAGKIAARAVAVRIKQKPPRAEGHLVPHAFKAKHCYFSPNIARGPA